MIVIGSRFAAPGGRSASSSLPFLAQLWRRFFDGMADFVASDVGFIAGNGRLKSEGFDRGALQLSRHDSKCLVLSPLKDGN